MAGLERGAVARDDVGVFVLLDADAVAGAVDELLAPAGLGDDPAGGGVDLLARRADDGGRHRRLLRVEQHGVGLGHLLGRLAEVHAARDVGAVADAVVAEHGAAEVAEHHLALADDAIAGLVVGAGGVVAGRDDGEVHPVVALGPQAASELGRHLRLGAPGQLDVAGLELGGHAVGGRACPTQRLDLGGVLARAQRTHHLAAPGEDAWTAGRAAGR